jgi:hypothetical protein
VNVRTAPRRSVPGACGSSCGSRCPNPTLTEVEGEPPGRMYERAFPGVAETTVPATAVAPPPKALRTTDGPEGRVSAGQVPTLWPLPREGRGLHRPRISSCVAPHRCSSGSLAAPSEVFLHVASQGRASGRFLASTPGRQLPRSHYASERTSAATGPRHAVSRGGRERGACPRAWPAPWRPGWRGPPRSGRCRGAAAAASRRPKGSARRSTAPRSAG